MKAPMRKDHALRPPSIGGIRGIISSISNFSVLRLLLSSFEIDEVFSDDIGYEE